MNCPNCNAVLGDGAKFCTRCGTKITVNAMTNAQPIVGTVGVCKVCGAKLNPNVKFCTTCGTATGVASTPVAPKVVDQAKEIQIPKLQITTLLRFKNNEKIKIEGEEFVIGKKQGMVSYCISDNPTISRVHAKIIKRSGQYFIIDMGSTNHTYVNDSLVPANTEIPLVNGTKIRLSNEDFLFQS